MRAGESSIGVTAEPPAGQIPAEAAQLTEQILGFIISKSIHVAAELGIADAIGDGRASSEELALQLGLHEPSLRRLLRTLASADLFSELDGDTYALTERGQLLRAEHAGSLRDLAIYFGEASDRSWRDPFHTLRTGSPSFDHVMGQDVWEFFDANPKAAQAFHGALAQTMPGRVLALLNHPWRGTETVCDVGGGNGAQLIALLEERDGLAGIVLDRPSVAEQARIRIAAAGLADRLGAVAGELGGPYPDADVYVMTLILHDWHDDAAVEILRSARRSISEEATLLLVESVMTTAAGSPTLPLLGDMHMMMETGGRERTRAEWAALLTAGGFTLHDVAVGVPFCLLTATPAAAGSEGT
jgi:hypothetical protein